MQYPLRANNDFVMADSAISTSLLDPIKMKISRKNLSEQYNKEVHQSREFNILEELLRGAASPRVSVHNQADEPSPNPQLETETRTEEKTADEIKQYPEETGGLNPEYDLLLRESKIILHASEVAIKSNRSESSSQEVQLKRRFLIVLIKLQKQQLARQCGTAGHVKLCEALIEFERRTETSKDPSRDNVICKMAEKFFYSEAARNYESFIKIADDEEPARRGKHFSDWDSIIHWMEMFEPLHENYIKISPPSKLPGFKNIYKEFKRLYRHQSPAKTLQPKDRVKIWTSLKKFCSEATKSLVLFFYHTETFWMTPHGKKENSMKEELQSLMKKLMLVLPAEPTETDSNNFRRQCYGDLIGSTTFEILTECHEIVQGLTTFQDEPTESSETGEPDCKPEDTPARENLKKFVSTINWADIKKCLQCKDADMKSRVHTALNNEGDIKQLKRFILSDLDATFSSQEWEAVRLHKKAVDALEGGGGIEIIVRKYLLRELDRRHLECKGKGSLSQLSGQINPVEVDPTGPCEDCKNSARAKLSLERILDGEKLPVEDQQYLLTILDKPSSCEHCERILRFQEVYQIILEDLPLSKQQSLLMSTEYPENNACKRCSVIGSQKMQPEKNDTCKDLKETYQIHPNCKMCQDMLLCIKTYESMSQEAPLEKDTREFVSEMLKNVENQWKCEGKSTNCMETFSELCQNKTLSPKSRSDIIEKLNLECSSICPYCQYQMWTQTIKCVSNGAALQEEQVEFLKDVILSHACKGCCMLMEQIKVRKTLEESKVLSSNLRALLSEKILPTTSYYTSCRQLKRCMTVLKKLNADDILTQDDEWWIRHISAATKNCQADGCNASHKEEQRAFNQNPRRPMVDIWKAGLKCESCHAKLLHVREAVHAQVDEKYSNVLEKIREHLSCEQRLECNICEGFYVPPEPLNLNHLQLKEKVTPSQMKEMLGPTLRFPAVISKNRERKKASKKGSGKNKGPDRDVARMTGEKCGNQKEAVTKEKDPSQRGFHPLTSTSGDRGCQEEDQDEDTTKGAWPGTCQNEEGKEVDEGNKHSWQDTADDKSEKAASSSESSGSTATVARETQMGGKNNPKRKGGVRAGKGRGRKLASRRTLRSGPGGPKESLASVQSKIREQGRDEKEGQKPKVPKKRNSVDNSVSPFEEMAAIDDVVNVLLKWRKKLGVPLCLLTNYDYASICGKKKEASSSHGEIDIIGFSPHVGVLFVELKAVSPEGSNIKRSLRVAQEQLQKDEIFFLEVNRDWLRDGVIPVIPLIALPYVPCSILAKMGLCNLHKSHVLTKCDMDKFILEPGNWNKFIGIPSKNLVVNNDYCKLVERFCCKYLFETQCSLTKELKTVGRDMSGVVLTEDQTKLIMPEHIPYQFLAGGYGTGKSLMLVLKAQEIAKGKLHASGTPRGKSIFMVSCTDITVSGEKINIEQPDGSLNHLKRLMGNENHPSPSYFDHIEFLMVRDFSELTPKTEAGEDLAETLANAIKSMASLLPEVHFFFDEIPFKFLESFKPHIEKLIKEIPSIKTFWFSVATHSFRANAIDHQNADWVKCECPKGFNFKYLKENLRVPGNTLRLQKQFEKAMDDGHGGTERGHVPPGPKPLLYRVPLCNCQNVQDHSIVLDDDCSRRRMTATLRAMFTKLGILVSDQAMATTYCKWPSNSITMLLPSVTNKSHEKGLSDLLKHSCAELGIDLEDRRYKTPSGGNALNPSHITGHSQEHVRSMSGGQAGGRNTEWRVDNLQVSSLGRIPSTESDYGLDNLEKHNSPVPVQDGASKSRQEPTKRPKITLTTETGFFNCESYVIISVDLSAMMYCFRGSKVAYSTCGISRCLSQYVHLTWHFKEAEKFFNAQPELAEHLSENEKEYARRMKPSLEKFLEEGHIVEETVEKLPGKCGKCQTRLCDIPFENS